jgi:hypothetical protein
MRDIVDAIRYLNHYDPVWRAPPADFPPAGTVCWRADKWQADGSAERMHDDLRDRSRLAAGRKTAPTAAIIDSQPVKGSALAAPRRGGGFAADTQQRARPGKPSHTSSTARGQRPEARNYAVWRRA